MNDFASSSCHDRIADFKITQVQRDSHFDMGESHYHPYYEFITCCPVSAAVLSATAFTGSFQGI